MSERPMMAVLSLGIAVVFGIAAWLTPDPRGYGTHHQLGLPECSFRRMTGINCPHCGMTTSFSCLVRGRIGESLRANPMGIVLAGLLIMLFPWCAAIAISGRRSGITDPASWLICGAVVYSGIVCLFWIVRLPGSF
jgi:hypothetical protein